MTSGILTDVGNHLWQSTLFALCVAALAQALRGVPARTRFWLWFAGLVKFLVPFSLLLALGSSLAPRRTGATELQPAPFYQVDAASQPFTFTPPALAASAKTALRNPLLRVDRLLLLLAAIWAFGFLVAICIWLAGWRQVAGILRIARPNNGGFENAILDRLRERMRIKSPVTLLVSESAMEPGVVGIWRSTLVWPRGISERLNEDQIEAIITHELAHVRRRDNLTAALAMLCAAIFWFHPLVWWLKSRAMNTRERACDEAVILLGSEPEVFASSILRACEFSIESPLACVSGITGSDLKERVRRIMCGNPADRLSRGAAIFLAGLCVAVILTPIAFGFLDTPRASAALLEDTETKPQFRFEVATVKPSKDAGATQSSLLMSKSRFTTENIALLNVIMFAYDAKSISQVSGYPNWVATARYDIEAKEDESTSAALDKMSRGERLRQVRLMVQALLLERFQLKVSRDVKELPVYALVIAKGGPKLTESVDSALTPGGKSHGSGFRMQGHGNIQAFNASLDVFAGGPLSKMPETEGRVVVNKTGLTGNYDFTLTWAPERSAPGAGDPSGAPASNAEEDSRPGLFIALEDELGLKLESQKGSVEGLVVDHVERPSAN